MLGTAFAPLLYAIVGSDLRFNLGSASYRVVLNVLVCRWLLNLVGIAVVRLMPWGLDARARGVMTLLMLTPLPSMFIMYTGLYGYRADKAAVIYNLSAISSLFALNALEPYV